MATPAVWTHPVAIIADVLSLHPDAFRTLGSAPGSWLPGVIVVLVAGLSEALGQSVGCLLPIG